jgi:hypothetical protein
MKNAIFGLLFLCSSVAFSCPDFSGKYIGPMGVELDLSQTGCEMMKQNGVDIPIDGKLHPAFDSLTGSNRTLHCYAFKFQGDILMDTYTDLTNGVCDPNGDPEDKYTLYGALFFAKGQLRAANGTFVLRRK